MSRFARRKTVTARHDHIVQLLAQLFRASGANVHVESRSFNEDRVRPDLEIILADRVVFVDPLPKEQPSLRLRLKPMAHLDLKPNRWFGSSPFKVQDSRSDQEALAVAASQFKSYPLPSRRVTR